MLMYYKKKNEKSFESYSNVPYLLKCSAFGSVPNELACMGFWCLY